MKNSKILINIKQNCNRHSKTNLKYYSKSKNFFMNKVSAHLRAKYNILNRKVILIFEKDKFPSQQKFAEVVYFLQRN